MIMKLWIARDKNDALALYTEEPTLYYDEYYEGPYKSQRIDLDENLFPEINFENSPQEIKLGLEKESIIKILKTYDNIFGLSDGGIARNEGDFEHIAEVIIKNM